MYLLVIIFDSLTQMYLHSNQITLDRIYEKNTCVCQYTQVHNLIEFTEINR